MPSTDANNFHITIINKTSFFAVIYSNYYYYELIYMFLTLYLVRGGLRTPELAPLRVWLGLEGRELMPLPTHTRTGP